MKYNIGDQVCVHTSEYTFHTVEVIKILDTDTYQVLEVLPTGALDWLYGEIYEGDTNHHKIID